MSTDQQEPQNKRPKAKTNAERQAAYRRRALLSLDAKHQLNTYLAADASLALGRLARHYGVTKRAMLGRLITAADEEIWMAMKSGTPEWDRYHGR